MTAPVVRIAAAILWDERGRLLLVRKRGTSAFMQPGGKIEPGEVPEAALARELLGELGLAIPVGAARFRGMFRAEAANEPGHVVEAELFDVVANGAIAPAAEIEEARWFTPDEAERVELAPLTRRFVIGLTPPVA